MFVGAFSLVASNVLASMADGLLGMDFHLFLSVSEFARISEFAYSFPGKAPELADFCGGGAIGIDLDGGAAVRHRGGIVNPVMNDGLENLSVLGKGGDRLDGNPGVGFGLCQDKDEGRGRVLHEVERRAQGPKVVGAWARGDENQVGELEDLPVLFGEGRGRVDKAVSETGLGERVKFFRKLAEVDRRKLGRFGLADVPPCGKCLLGVGVDQNGGAVAGILGGDGQMRGKSGFAAAAFLGSDNDGFHWHSHGLW